MGMQQIYKWAKFQSIPSENLTVINILSLSITPLPGAHP